MHKFYRPNKYDNIQKGQKKVACFASELSALTRDKESEINELTITYFLTYSSFKYIVLMTFKGKLTSICTTISEKIRQG